LEVYVLIHYYQLPTEIFNTQKPTIMGLLSLVYTKLNNLKSLLFQILMLIFHRFPLINFEKKTGFILGIYIILKY